MNPFNNVVNCCKAQERSHFFKEVLYYLAIELRVHSQAIFDSIIYCFAGHSLREWFIIFRTKVLFYCSPVSSLVAEAELAWDDDLSLLPDAHPSHGTLHACDDLAAAKSKGVPEFRDNCVFQYRIWEAAWALVKYGDLNRVR